MPKIIHFVWVHLSTILHIYIYTQHVFCADDVSTLPLQERTIFHPDRSFLKKIKLHILGWWTGTNSIAMASVQVGKAVFLNIKVENTWPRTFTYPGWCSYRWTRHFCWLKNIFQTQTLSHKPNFLLHSKSWVWVSGLLRSTTALVGRLASKATIFTQFLRSLESGISNSCSWWQWPHIITWLKECAVRVCIMRLLMMMMLMMVTMHRWTREDTVGSH